jgi:hypothetical protein
MSDAGLRTISNACPQTYPQGGSIKYLYEKPASASLTKPVITHLKIADQKLINTLQAA